MYNKNIYIYSKYPVHTLTNVGSHMQCPKVTSQTLQWQILYFYCSTINDIKLQLLVTLSILSIITKPRITNLYYHSKKANLQAHNMRCGIAMRHIVSLWICYFKKIFIHLANLKQTFRIMSTFASTFGRIPDFYWSISTWQY